MFGLATFLLNLSYVLHLVFSVYYTSSNSILCERIGPEITAAWRGKKNLHTTNHYATFNAKIIWLQDSFHEIFVCQEVDTVYCPQAGSEGGNIGIFRGGVETRPHHALQTSGENFASSFICYTRYLLFHKSIRFYTIFMLYQCNLLRNILRCVFIICI
jgi:hypothetical protein